MSTSQGKWNLRQQDMWNAEFSFMEQNFFFSFVRMLACMHACMHGDQRSALGVSLCHLFVLFLGNNIFHWSWRTPVQLDGQQAPGIFPRSGITGFCHITVGCFCGGAGIKLRARVCTASYLLTGPLPHRSVIYSLGFTWTCTFMGKLSILVQVLSCPHQLSKC